MPKCYNWSLLIACFCLIYSSDAVAQSSDTHISDSLNQLLTEAQQQNDINRQIDLHTELGWFYSNNPNLRELAKFHYQSGMQKARQQKDSPRYGNLANYMGQLFLDQANFDSTIYYFLEAQKAYKGNSTYAYAHTYSSIGSLYFTFNAYKSALNYYRKSLTLKQKNPEDSWSIPFAYWCIAECHYALEDSDSALYYYQLSSSVADTTRDIPYYGNEGIAQILIDQQLYDSALVVLEPVAPWYLDAGISGWISDLGLLYMRIYLEKQQKAEFNKWSAVVRKEAFVAYLPEQRRRFYQTMSEYHQRFNRLDSAFYYQQKTTQQWEEISKAQGKSNIDKLITAFEALQYQSDLQRQELEQEAQHIENKRLSETNRLFTWIITLLVLLFVFLIIMLFLLNRQRKKTHRRNLEIQSANSQITEQLVQLNNKEERMRLMQMQSDNLYIAFDADYKIMLVNDAFTEHFPTVEGEVTEGTDLRTLLTESQSQELELVLNKITPFGSDTLKWQWKSPFLFGVRFKIIHLLDDPSVKGFVMEGQNITDTLLEHEGERSKFQDQLKKKDEILSNVHHKVALSHLKLELKQKMLQEIDTRLDRSNLDSNSAEINEVQRRIKQENHVDRHWDDFLLHFDAANSAFFKKLKELHPRLTKNDEKHCAFLLLRLTNKEVGMITGVTPDSVKKARQRLKKKLQLNSEQSLSDYLDGIIPNEK